MLLLMMLTCRRRMLNFLHWFTTNLIELMLLRRRFIVIIHVLLHLIELYLIKRLLKRLLYLILNFRLDVIFFHLLLLMLVLLILITKAFTLPLFMLATDRCQSIGSLLIYLYLIALFCNFTIVILLTCLLIYLIVFDYFLINFLLNVIKHVFFDLHVTLLHLKLLQQFIKIHIKQLSLGTKVTFGRLCAIIW